MRINRKCILFLIGVILLVPNSAPAIPVPALNLVELTRNAGLIAVGHVTSVRDEGAASLEIGGRTLSARQRKFTLRVQRVLKGPAVNDVECTMLLPDQPIGYGIIPKTQFGMFFLRKQSAQVFTVANPYYPFIVASPAAPVTEGEPLDQIVAELTYVAGSPATAAEDRVRAVTILDKVVTAGVTMVLTQVAHERNGAASNHAVAALLRRNESSVIELAERILLDAQNADADLRRQIAYSIRDGVTDPSTIPSLTRLLRAAEVETRLSAAAALRHVGTESVIEPLGLALNDDHREVRYQAVLGLAAVTGQADWGPSIELYASDEERYVTHWKDWLKVR